MLNFLDSVKDDVFIVNSLQGMREANNKLYTAAFGDAIVTLFQILMYLRIRTI